MFVCTTFGLLTFYAFCFEIKLGNAASLADYNRNQLCDGARQYNAV